TLSLVSKGGASSRVCACRPARTCQPDASSQAIFCKPRATFSCRQKYHLAYRQGQPRARARPDASSAFPKSDPGVREKSCSDERLRPSTRCATCPYQQIRTAQYLSRASATILFPAGPTSLSPLTVVDLRRSV